MERGRQCVHVHITRSFVRDRIPIYYAWTKYKIVSVVRKFFVTAFSSMVRCGHGGMFPFL